MDLQILKTTAAAFAVAVLLGGTALAEEWSFTDGAGVTITLDTPPERIVVFSASAAGLMQFGIQPVGVFVDSTVPEVSFSEFDLGGIEVIRTAWNELQPESLLALEPDLIITEYWPHSQGYSGGEDMGPNGRFAQVAPVLGVENGDSIVGLIENYAELAEALGADLSDPEIAANLKAFETARDALTAAAAAKPGLKVMAGRDGGENLMIAVPAGAGELLDFMRWGVDIVDPEAEEGSYWAFLSWENANTYPADIFIIDDRFGDITRDAVLAQPLARLLPAVAAGQVGDWPAWWIRTYTSYTDQLEKLTALIERSEVVTRD